MQRLAVSHHIEATFRVLVTASVVATYLLIVVGGLVRASESGLGCPDWPLCHGQAIPLAQLRGATLIEFSHRLITTLVSLLVVATAIVSWRYYRRETQIFRPSVLALGLLAVQIILGGVAVLLELPPTVVGIHLANALLLFACLIAAALYVVKPWPAENITSAATDRLPRLAVAAVVGTFILIVSGTVVAGAEAEDACLTWPLCNGRLLPIGNDLALLNMIHRYIAGAVGLHILYTLVQAWRTRRTIRAVAVATWATGLLLVAQVAIGAVNVVLDFPVATNVLHLATAAALWAAVVAFTILIKETRPTPIPLAAGHQAGTAAPVRSQTSLSAYTEARRDAPLSAHDALPRAQSGVAVALAPTILPLQLTAPARTGSHSLREAAKAYLLLTKPWIVALLLATTLGAMLLSQAGIPELRIVFLTLIGGWLAASGSGSLNSYIDRDIDKQMARTARRPLPSGQLTSRQALIFGTILTILGIATLALFVNLLSAALALIGSLYYVVVYTLILKRSTPQSVVIGGVAGALPPLVGWTAVTGRLDALALVLALVIFLWTPPHTWALVLMVSKDYERVGVPMLPVAYGLAETRRQIVFYSLLLFGVALLPYLLHDLSIVYLLLALLLNLRFAYLAVKLWHDQTKATARRLYRYSTIYLALMFLVMVIDHAVLLPHL